MIATLLNVLLVGVVFLLTITILVAAHELGHYLFARLFKMGVNEFAIGFGSPVIKVWRRKKYRIPGDDEEHETEFTLRPWPIGGYVKIFGMVPADDGSEVHTIGGFFSKPPWQRIIVLLAGPIFSLLAGVMLLFPLYATQGIQRPIPVVGGMSETGAGAKAGIKPGDRILTVEGKPIRLAFDLLSTVRERANQPTRMTIQRGPTTFELTVTPEEDKAPTDVFDERLQPTGERKKQGKIGIGFQSEHVKIPIGQALYAAVEEPYNAILSIKRLILAPSRASEEAGGVISMVNATNVVVSQGYDRVIWLAAMLSISVGVFNLLPIPPLDGGQILIALAEALRGGRRLSMQTQMALMQAGFGLLLLLFLSVTFLDIKRVAENRFAAPPAAEQTPKK